MKHVDRSDLVVIAEILKSDIERSMDDACLDYAGWVYKSSKALSDVVRELGHGSLNPFNDSDWSVIAGKE